MLRIETASAMLELGGALSQVLRAGDLVILDGPLGAGKTTFVQGLAQGLKVDGNVTSPTFVIARVHPARSGPSLVHVDAYRLTSLAEIDDLGIDEDLDESVTVVEWGVRAVDHWAEYPLLLEIRRENDAMLDSRTIAWRADRKGWQDRWERLTEVLGPPAD